MKVLLINNRFKEPTEVMARNIAAQLKEKGICVAIDNGAVTPPTREADLIVVLGGDGTILRAARQYARAGIPVLGVNMGTVGFLSNIEVNEFDGLLDVLLAGKYNLDERMMLEIKVCSPEGVRQEVLCLNEMVIKSLSARMVSLPIEINGETTGTYRGDGLIVSTPTGSTAYSLSSGGPVVDPRLEAVLVTPIASHVISRRPMVIDAAKTIIFPCLQPEEAYIAVDGQVRLDFAQDDYIEIKRSAHRLKLVDLKGESFFSVIDNKLRRSEGVI